MGKRIPQAGTGRIALQKNSIRHEDGMSVRDRMKRWQPDLMNLKKVIEAIVLNTDQLRWMDATLRGRKAGKL